MQPCCRIAPLSSSCVMPASDNASWNSLPSFIKICGLPSTKDSIYLLFNTNFEVIKLSTIKVTADINPPISELSPAFIEF